MPDVPSLATIYVKKDFHTVAGNDGIEEACWATLLPPYFVASQYWIRGRVMGTTEVASMAIQEYRMSGRFGQIDRQILTDASPPSAATQFVTDLMETFLPHEPGSIMDGSADAQEDVGLTGSGVVPVGGQEFFTREIELGLPKHALVTDADLIRYVDRFDTKGSIPRKLRGEYEQAHMIGFGITTEDKINMAADFEDNAIFGAAANATPQLPLLLDDILDAVQQSGPSMGDIGFIIGRDALELTTRLQNWQTASFGDAHVASGTTLTVDMTITLKVDIRIPQYDAAHPYYKAS